MAFSKSKTVAWWRNLQPSDEPGRWPNGDRGALARLRRSATVMDASTEPATLVLCRQLELDFASLEKVALLAAVLAWVREEDNKLSVARQIGAQAKGAAPMSDLRFRRLLQAGTPEEHLMRFRRLVVLAGRKLNVGNLAEGVWDWDSDRTRQYWSYVYYNAPGADASGAEQGAQAA